MRSVSANKRFQSDAKTSAFLCYSLRSNMTHVYSQLIAALCFKEETWKLV
ncbi:hypothetical protein QWZ16_23595 [Vibrio ostreicida]|uniref:Uncharacterized protein n=1 Tax=Vibrio ostreicida TaxID=526588 RepID=A0ABT8BYY3_9VIBR|nr:hypothetical protein [Vibrio ostreicida]MDN3611255.1 hypothetical protein [Vibrio ostreicida]MDN3612586.1 hypothetical protein [Vibrio ostreicida]